MKAFAPPFWLRICVFLAIAALHFGALAAFIITPPTEDADIEYIEVGVIAQGEAAMTQADRAAMAQDQTSSHENAPAQDNASNPISAERTPPPPPIFTEAQHNDGFDLSKENAQNAPTAAQPSNASSDAQEITQTARIGAEESNAARSGGARRTAYGGQLVAEINRRRFYPAAARARGQTGETSVAFVIGPDGRAASCSVTRSSGHQILDEAACEILRAVRAPPPPNGSFRNTTTLKFKLK